jgi:hypothetical protein
MIALSGGFIEPNDVTPSSNPVIAELERFTDAALACVL